MSKIAVSTPDSERIDSQSALDFMYWAVDMCGTFYPRSTAVTDFVGSPSDEALSVNMAVFCLSQVGIPVTEDFDSLYNYCIDGSTTLADAIHTRGAFLFRGRGIAYCLGDSQRIIEAVGNEYVLRFLSDTEKVEGYWSLTARVPGMVYL